MENTLRDITSRGRIDTWTKTVEQELQSLVGTAATLRKNITEAKTTTKREYYNKKFKKVQGEVMSMLATLQRLREMSSRYDSEGVSDANVEQPST
jgi:glutaredoxin 2